MNPNFQAFEEQGEWIHLIHRQIIENTLSHAYLISGEEGVGKKSLANLMAAALLCHDHHQRPCYHCASCRLFQAGDHPDFIVIQKGVPISPKEDKAKTVIPVADIEELETRCASHPFEGDRRVVAIYNAEDMNLPAQNKLLKTLEDPPDGTFFLLTCEKKDLLLPTIVSRCLSVYLHPWSRDTVLEILEEEGYSGNRALDAADESSGSIGKALKLAGDEKYWEIRDEIHHSFFHAKTHSEILAISNRWKDRRNDAEILFSTIESGIIQLLEDRMNGRDSESDEEMKKLYDISWLRFARSCDLAAFSALLDAMATARKRLQASVNFQVIIEQILFLLMEAKSKWSM